MTEHHFIRNAIILLCVLTLSILPIEVSHAGELWKAGVARVDITPTDSMRMAGYAARDHLSEGTLHNLWAKALSLEDSNGKQSLLITVDVLGLPKHISDEISSHLSRELDLDRSDIILSSSHTHSGPDLADEWGYDLLEYSPSEIAIIEKYTDELIEKIQSLGEKAFQNMEPATVASANGVARFAVNRRNNESDELRMLSDLDGPIDHDVPVMRVSSSSGELMAVVFGYACHPTVLSWYQWSGDYPGFAQIALEREHPGATAMFFAGAAGDQNPLPRRSVGLAKQYGETLAAAVNRVLSEEMETLSPELTTKYSEVTINLVKPPTAEEIESLKNDLSGYQQKWAEGMLKKLKNGEKLRTTYPYPLQVWKVGRQAMVVMGGEVVVDYANKIKHMLGQDTFVMAYANDVMGYIPSVRILREGGYEAVSSQMFYGLPGPWASDVEDIIMNEILKLTGEVGVPLAEGSID